MREKRADSGRRRFHVGPPGHVGIMVIAKSIMFIFLFSFHLIVSPFEHWSYFPVDFFYLSEGPFLSLLAALSFFAVGLPPSVTRSPMIDKKERQVLQE